MKKANKHDQQLSLDELAKVQGGTLSPGAVRFGGTTAGDLGSGTFAGTTADDLGTDFTGTTAGDLGI